jgi:hypothetical protein
VRENNMSNTLGYLRGELKDAGKTSSLKGKKSVSFGKRVLEVGFIKKVLLAVYNKIFGWYYFRLLTAKSAKFAKKKS